MVDVELVIKIPEEYHKAIMEIPVEQSTADMLIIHNGTPIEKHDEEVIKQTVESIWGKPPYIELLDKIRDEIENYDNFIICANGQKGIHIDKALEIIDKYKGSEEK